MASAVQGVPVISLPGQLARTRRFTLGVPERFTVALGVDGDEVLFTASEEPTDRLRGEPEAGALP